MKSLRQAIQKSWFPEMTIIPGDLATSLQLTEPLSLIELTRHLDQPEERILRSPVDADALHGEAEFIMRSDGTYTFRGPLRATDFPSFAYKLQASVRCAAGVMIVVETSGRVFGTDTPGDRQREWREDNISESIRQYWTALRLKPQLETNLDKNLSGISGGLVDVAKTVIATYAGAHSREQLGQLLFSEPNLVLLQVSHLAIQTFLQV